MFFSKTKLTKISELAVFVSLQNLHQAVYDEASPLHCPLSGAYGGLYLSKLSPTWPGPRAGPSPTGFSLPTSLTRQGLGKIPLPKKNFLA